ncbi:MAG: glycosyltransferase family 4 protein [Methylococcaceae bacterium]
MWGASSYLILRDFFPQWVIDNGLLPAKSPITRYFRFFEALSYRAADTIGIQSPKNLAWFLETTATKQSLDLLYNWAANDPISTGDDAYRQQLGLDNKVVYFYGGNIGHAQDMMNIVRLAIAMQSEHEAHFVLVGAGDEVELVRDAIAPHALTNMTLLPSVSQGEFKKMLAEFDVGLFSLHHDHTTHNFPGKILGYMVQEKPILGSVNPENDLQDVLENAGAGLITVNGDDNLLKNALHLLHDADYRKNMGKNAKYLLDAVFSVEAAAQQILQRVERNT